MPRAQWVQSENQWTHNIVFAIHDDGYPGIANTIDADYYLGRYSR